MRLKLLLASALVLAASPPSLAQAPNMTVEAVEAPAEPDAIPLYGKATPGSAKDETWKLYSGKDRVVRNVTRPTLTPFLPDPAKATGSAVIIAPGGAFMLLAIEPEGWRVAQAFADRGIAAFVLKYRVMPTPVDQAEADAYMAKVIGEGLPDPSKQPRLQYPASTEDGLAALALVRHDAGKFGIDPKRVGMIGFSAGAMTTLNTVVAAKPGEGPDFFGYIYGPQAAITAPESAPPMFNAITFDDQFFPTMGFPIAEAWHKAGRQVEVHGYARGGHGFGLGVEGTTTPLMFDQFIAWMNAQGFGKPPLPAPKP